MHLSTIGVLLFGCSVFGQKHLNHVTDKFWVNGSALPHVPFDIGESYSGLLSNTPSGNSSLFFWYFPSDNPAAHDEITIFLNGGPGCSSMPGLMQENGPLLWAPGVYEPYRNPYAWRNLTNIVYIDQPAGSGYSPGPSTVKDENDIAEQFVDFWRHFMDVFDLRGRKVYVTGESYAGQYIPYIAEAMLEDGDKRYFDVRGVMIGGAYVNSDDVMQDAPAVASLNHNANIFGLNDTFMADINHRADQCGYTKLMNDGLVYPPTHRLPPAPSSKRPGCDIYNSIKAAATEVNPCFSMYELGAHCPFQWNVIGLASFAAGPQDYFNRSDVQSILHVPTTNWKVCNTDSFTFPGDHEDPSPPSGLGPLPRVIEKTHNVLLGHGWLDFALLANATLLTIQNMTWNGMQGFQRPPVEPLYVPHPRAELKPGQGPLPFTQTAGSGIMGTAHTERGLTFSGVKLAGHSIPYLTPGAAYRQLEFLLGRISTLGEGKVEERFYSTEM